MAQICFVSDRQSTYFFTELLGVLAQEASDHGARVTMAMDAFPSFEEPVAYVFVPHAFMALAPKQGHPTDAQLRHTLAISTDPPGTRYFEQSAEHASRAARVMGLTRPVVAELARRGISAEHLRLGWSPIWDTWRRDEGVDRPDEVLFLGAATERRKRVLAGYGETLSGRRTSMLISPETARPQPRADFLVEKRKWEALRSAKTVLDIHRVANPVFHDTRYAEAISNGCVLVSEHSTGFEPLVPGEHFISGEAENLADLAVALVDDPDRLRTIRLSAYDFLRSEIPLSASVERLCELADEIAGPIERSSHLFVQSSPPLTTIEAEPSPIVERLQRAHTDDTDQIRIGLKKLALGQITLGRALSRQEVLMRDGDPDAAPELARTPTFDQCQPDVSVLVPLYNQGGTVEDALDSARASEGVHAEILVLDDASTDRGSRVVEEWIRAHPWAAAALFRREVNGGPAASRNRLLELARAPYAFLLDADNAVYPQALALLNEALDADPDAVFAYPIIEFHRAGESETIFSAHAWDPHLFQHGNYIDAMSLVRTEEVVALGGFTEDLRLQGWEDYDLWCRIAERGRHGVHVPRILGRYRIDHHSTQSTSNIDDVEGLSLMLDRNPRVMRGAPPPPDGEAAGL